MGEAGKPTHPLPDSQVWHRHAIDPDALSWSHIWLGETLGWHDVAPKTDGMMQSAGGIVTSPNDMIGWLELQLRASDPDAGLTATMLEAARTAYAQTGSPGDDDPAQMNCHGYALGWNVCTYLGFDVLNHGGGYTGARTIMTVLPEAGIAIAAFGDSDNMTGYWTQNTALMFIRFLADDPGADALIESQVETYLERTAELLAVRQQRAVEQQAEASWGGWAWQPSLSELDAFAGRYAVATLPVDVEITATASGLNFRFGDMQIDLAPAVADVFGGRTHPFANFDRVEFQRDESGEIRSLVWEDLTFDRVAAR